MPALLRLLGVAILALFTACAFDSAPARDDDTLGRWSDALHALAPLVAEARASIAESDAHGVTIRGRSAATRSAEGTGGMRARSLTRPIDALVEEGGAIVLRESGSPLLRVRRGRGGVQAERGTAVAADVVDGADAVLFARSPGIEDLLRLKSSAATVDYDIALPAGWTLFQPEGAPRLVEARDAFGLARARVKAERGWDASGRVFDVALAIDGSRVRVRPLTNGPYPIVVDPLWQATGTMVLVRDYPATTLLPNGRVLIVGAEKTGLAETFDPRTGTFTAVNNVTKALMWFASAIALGEDGTALVVGGRTEDGAAYLYDPSTNAFTETGGTHEPRAFGSAVRLRLGKVLVTGGGKGRAPANDPEPITSSAEIYEPVTRQFRDVKATMIGARAGHTSLVLASGEVLIVGGEDVLGDSSAERFDSIREIFVDASVFTTHSFAQLLPLPSGRVLVYGLTETGFGDPELYDPVTDRVTSPRATIHLTTMRTSALTLLSGRVLICGGEYVGPSATCSEYDPVLDKSFSGPPLLEPRWLRGTLPVLPSGGILIAGGADGAESLSSAEFLEPAPAEVVASGALCVPRAGHILTKLASGDLLLAGGRAQSTPNANRDGVLDTAEVLEPTTLQSRRVADTGHTASLLPSGQVVVIGGLNDAITNYYLETAERFDPAQETFRPVFGPMSVPRVYHAATVVTSGKVLVMGGSPSGTTAEILDQEHFEAVGTMAYARHTAAAALLPSGKLVLIAAGRRRGAHRQRDRARRSAP